MCSPPQTNGAEKRRFSLCERHVLPIRLSCRPAFAPVVAVPLRVALIGYTGSRTILTKLDGARFLGMQVSQSPLRDD
jgi:hypothetical protein